MGKSTHITVITGFEAFRITGTEFKFVLFRMIKLFHSVMTEMAGIAFFALLVVRLVGAGFGSIGA